jgi:hypothetical protein
MLLSNESLITSNLNIPQIVMEEHKDKEEDIIKISS